MTGEQVTTQTQRLQVCKPEPCQRLGKSLAHMGLLIRNTAESAQEICLALNLEAFAHRLSGMVFYLGAELGANLQVVAVDT